MKYFIFILFIFSIACKNQNQAPENIIPKEQMVDIIVKIHLADGMFTINEVRRKYASKDSTNYYDNIFEEYGYTRQDFDTSIYYYSHQINEYNKIYIEALNRLNELETKVKEESHELLIDEE